MGYLKQPLKEEKLDKDFIHLWTMMNITFFMVLLHQLQSKFYFNFQTYGWPNRWYSTTWFRI